MLLGKVSVDLSRRNTLMSLVPMDQPPESMALRFMVYLVGTPALSRNSLIARMSSWNVITRLCRRFLTLADSLAPVWP